MVTRWARSLVQRLDISGPSRWSQDQCQGGATAALSATVKRAASCRSHSGSSAAMPSGTSTPTAWKDHDDPNVAQSDQANGGLGTYLMDWIETRRCSRTSPGGYPSGDLAWKW